jgi:cyclopropane fatty-acyl-phospholipid synthase-like methyltransferase
MKREFQIEFLRSAGLRPEHYLLDIGCGTLRGGIPIIQYLERSHYYGTEVRAEVLAEAYNELEEAGIDKDPILILSKDVSKLDLGQAFNFVWAYSVLIHLSDEVLRDVLRFVRAHLAEDGRFLANVNIAKRQDGYWHEGFPVIWRPAGFYREEAARAGLEARDLGTVEALGFGSGHPGHDQHHILQFRVYGDAA